MSYDEFERSHRARMLLFARWAKRWPLRVPARWGMHHTQIAEMQEWLDANCTAEWSGRMEHTDEAEYLQRRRRPVVGFKDPDDAFSFKMRWA
ncbi:hypothetical protein [Methylobacterium sp. ID0610]|uniref:hypothetical protein n=1 Tax=Methylobacterium carpenticola TaxID=3344827 RepID=UPI003691D308